MILRITKTKEASTTWEHLLPLLAKKVKSMPSVGKIMANVFWNHNKVLIVNPLDYGKTATTECQCSTLEMLWQATITKSLGCFAKVNQNSGRLWTTILTIPLPCPVSLISWTHHEALDWHAIYSRCWCASRWHLLATDTWHQFLPSQDINLGVTAG